jgi:uncharacterized protein (DUF58 family)
MDAPAPGLDPVVIAKIAPLELRARRILDGALAGRHKSRRVGQALEFVGHRAYAPSDDWRRIDWKVFAKTDRWVVREQEEETALRALFLLDTSASMNFSAGGRLSKGVYGGLLLSALGYLLIHNRESVGLGFFSDKINSLWPVRGGMPQLSLLLQSLSAPAFGGQAHWRPALEEAGQRLKRRSFVCLVSDFLGDAEDILSAARLLVSKKHDVAALQVLDPVEQTLDFSGDLLFKDLETGAEVRGRAEAIAPLYQKELAAHQAKLARGFSSLGIDWQTFSTDRPLEDELSLYLRRRGAQ